MDAALNVSDGICMTNRTAIENSDAQLMLRFKQGDREAFELLFSRYARAMINFAYRFVRNREMAEELAQEVFLRVYEGASGYEVQARFTAWLYRIATNICLNEIRKPRFRATHEPLENSRLHDYGSGAAASQEKNGPAILLEQQAVSRAIRQAMEQLPDKQRAAFVLNKYEELSYAEVADIMRISEKAVKSLIHRAKETLAERLKPLLPELFNL